MAKTRKNDVVEETTVIDTSTEEPLVRRGQAVPVDPATGAPALDAPAPVLVTGEESTSHQLAQTKGSAESREPSHIGAHRIGVS